MVEVDRTDLQQIVENLKREGFDYDEKSAPVTMTEEIVIIRGTVGGDRVSVLREVAGVRGVFSDPGVGTFGPPE